MRTDWSFDHFYVMVGKPTLSARLEVGAGAPSYPQTAKDHFRRVYYEDIDLIVSAIDQRFNQGSFSSYTQMETLLVTAANGETMTQSSSFLKHHTAKMFILGRYLGN